jgi:hypothetical protein
LDNSQQPCAHPPALVPGGQARLAGRGKTGTNACRSLAGGLAYQATSRGLKVTRCSGAMLHVLTEGLHCQILRLLRRSSRGSTLAAAGG